MKKIVKIAFVVAFAAIAGCGVYVSQKSDLVSDLLLANVEALANDTENPWCPNGCVANGNGCQCYTWYGDLKEYGH